MRTPSPLEAIRRADAVRTISSLHHRPRSRGSESSRPASFPRSMDLERFTPGAADAAAATIRQRSSSVCSSYTRTSTGSQPPGESSRPGCRETQLRIVGRGSAATSSRRSSTTFLGRTGWLAQRLNEQESGRTLDDATCLLLPSRSEGLRRIVVEALCRGRPVVATRGRGNHRPRAGTASTACSSSPRSPARVADALVHVLGGRRQSSPRRLAAAARPSVESWIATPKPPRAPHAPARRPGAPMSRCVLFVGPTRILCRSRPAWNSSGRRSSSSSRSVLICCPEEVVDKEERAVQLVGGSFYGALPCSGPAGDSRLSAAGDRGRGSTDCDPRDRATGAPVIAEVHGNWRHSTRLYGSPARRALAARRPARRGTA